MKYLFMISLFFILPFAYGQTTISGTVKDGHGEALGFANIYMENSYDGNSSENDGQFSFQTNEKGTQTIIADFLGYESMKQTIQITGDAVHLEFILKEKFNKLKAVTVTAGSFEAGDKKKVAVLKPLDIVTTAGAMGDISNALQTLPGTTTVGESGRLFVRGGSSEETQTYIDGMHAPVAYTSGSPNLAVRGRFNPMMFKGTIFNTGGYSAEYGQALSSVLLLNTQDFQPKDRLDISLMTIGLGLSGTKNWDRTSLTASLDYTNLSPYFKIVKQRFETTTPWESLNGAISFRQKTGKTGLFKLYATNNYSRSALNIFDFNSPDQSNSFSSDNDNIFINASWKTTIGKKWSVKTGISYTDDKNDVLYGKINLSNHFSQWHLKANATYFFTDKITIKAGVEQFRKSISEKIYKDTLQNSLTAGFTEANIYISQKLVLRVGGRLENISLLNKTKISPRVSAAYKVNDHSQFSFAYGQFHQNPADKYIFQKTDLGLEKADHYILNYQIDNNKRLLRTEIYFKNYDKLLKYDQPFNAGSFKQTGTGYATGLDVFYRDLKSIKNSKFWISYSYLISERDYQDFPIQSTPTFVAKHHISLVYKYWMSKWSSYISTTISASSPRPYNDPNQTLFNNEKTKAYKTVNLSWSYLPKPSVVLYAAVTNIFKFKNSFGYEYAQTPDINGQFSSHEILPSADQFFFLGCFITLSRTNENQIDQLN